MFLYTQAFPVSGNNIYYNRYIFHSLRFTLGITNLLQLVPLLFSKIYFVIEYEAFLSFSPFYATNEIICLLTTSPVISFINSSHYKLYLPKANLSSWYPTDVFLRTDPLLAEFLISVVQFLISEPLPNFVWRSSWTARRSAERSAPISADCKYERTTLQQYVQTRKSPKEHRKKIIQ